MADSSETAPLLSREHDTKKDIVSPHQNTSASRTWSRPALLGIAALACVLGAYWTTKQNLVSSVSETYALCARDKVIWTVDPAHPRVECIGVREGAVFAVGELDNVKKAWAVSRTATSETKEDKLNVVYAPKGSIVVPGLADAHAHILQWGYKMQLPLDGSASVSEVVQRVRNYILSHPDILNDTSAWIEGMGWDQTKWPGKAFPTAADLDADPLLRGRPIMLQRTDVHAAWVSGKVLELTAAAHGGKLPTHIDGGEIIRGADGEPSGVLVDNAMGLVPTPSWSETRMEDYFARAMKDALQHGLTSIHDAATSPEMIQFFKKKAEEGKLPIRLYLMGNAPGDEYWGSKIQKLENHGIHRRLTVRAVKLFTDGALGSWGAALLAPYSDKPDTSGLLRTAPATLERLARQFWADGFQVNIHCIGDRANRVVLDIFERLVKKDPESDRRPRVEHAQIIAPDDLERAGKLGVIASVQPTHATSDMWYAETRLGSERIKGAYAYQTLLNTSRAGVLPLGSDFPVEDINPLLGFYAAVSRLSTSGDSPHGKDGWFAEQRLTREQALKGMTADAAFASFAEAEHGILAVGKKADYVILDHDIMNAPFAEILKTKVIATAVDGQLMYGGVEK